MGTKSILECYGFIDAVVDHLYKGETVVVDVNPEDAMLIAEEWNGIYKGSKFVIVLAATEKSRSEFYSIVTSYPPDCLGEDCGKTVEITSSFQMKKELSNDPSENRSELIVLPKVMLDLKKKYFDDVFLLVIEKADEIFFGPEIAEIRKRYDNVATLLLTSKPEKFIAENKRSRDTRYRVLAMDDYSGDAPLKRESGQSSVVDQIRGLSKSPLYLFLFEFEKREAAFAKRYGNDFKHSDLTFGEGVQRLKDIAEIKRLESIANLDDVILAMLREQTKLNVAVENAGGIEKFLKDED